MGSRTDTRQRMVVSAALLLRERGVAETSVAKVLEHSGGPRGSVRFHFPGGRAELLSDALRWAGGLVTARLRAAAEEGLAPAEVFRGMCEYYRAQLISSGFTAACPVWAAVQEAYNDPALGPVTAGIVDDWVSLLAGRLTRAGHDPRRAADTALLCVSSLEGAITMARVRRSAEPIDVMLAALLPLLTTA